MKNKIKLLMLLMIFSVSLFAQKKENKTPIYNEINELPEYVVITSQNTKLLGGINISIDSKKSPYEVSLNNLMNELQSRKKQKIRNQTDLLNSMSIIGFEYVDAYNASQVQYASDSSVGDDILNEILEGGTGTYRVNMIFRKKEAFR